MYFLSFIKTFISHQHELQNIFYQNILNLALINKNLGKYLVNILKNIKFKLIVGYGNDFILKLTPKLRINGYLHTLPIKLLIELEIDAESISNYIL